jgi:hypothetical protein
VEEIIEFMGITFHLSPGQRACFKYEDGTYTGYASNRTKLDTFFQILTDIEADKRRRQWEAIPPNIRKLAEQIHKRRNPEKITAAICGMIRTGAILGVNGGLKNEHDRSGTA